MSQIELYPMPGTDAIENADKTMFFYSRGKIYLYFIGATILMLLGLLFYSIEPVPFGIGGIGMALYLFITAFIMLYNRNNPQLIINERGIQIRKSPFYTWAVIKYVGFESRRYGKGYQQYLVVWVNGGTKEIKIDNLDRKEKFLSAHIERCRARYQRLGIV